MNFINGTGRDTRNEGQQNQHLLIKEVDVALSSLITDLELQGMLAKIPIAIVTESGRPAADDFRGGRGHQCVSGANDDVSRMIVENPVTVLDFQATILATFSIDPAQSPSPTRAGRLKCCSVSMPTLVSS